MTEFTVRITQAGVGQFEGLITVLAESPEEAREWLSKRSQAELEEEAHSWEHSSGGMEPYGDIIVDMEALSGPVELASFK